MNKTKTATSLEVFGSGMSNHLMRVGASGLDTSFPTVGTPNA